MKSIYELSRRAVVIGQAGLAGLAALPSVAWAHSSTQTVRVAEAIPTATVPALPPRWDTATAQELSPFVGQRFRVKSKEHGTLVLKLVAVEASRSGPDRPLALKRREGVRATFDSPDAGPLVADGDGTYRVSHPQIGAADLFMSASPRRYGGSYLEVVLN